MAPKSYSLLYALLALLFALSSLQVKAALLGGWQPIKDPNDPYVVDIGKFAIGEHNKETNSKLVFQTVLKGQQQVVSGMNYKLVITAKDGAASHRYEAVVYDKPWEKLRKLTSFKEIA